MQNCRSRQSLVVVCTQSGKPFDWIARGFRGCCCYNLYPKVFCPHLPSSSCPLLLQWKADPHMFVCVEDRMLPPTCHYLGFKFSWPVFCTSYLCWTFHTFYDCDCNFKIDLKAVNNPQVELTTAKNMTLYEIIFSAHCHKNKVENPPEICRKYDTS